MKDDNSEINTNAEMEYRRADSIIISITIRGRRLVPGIRDTTRIRMTIITVDSTVVTTDRMYELIDIALNRLLGMSCGVTSRANMVIPRAESIYHFTHPQEALHTYRS